MTEETGKMPRKKHLMFSFAINDLLKKLEDSVSLRDAATKDIAEVTADIVQTIISDGRGDLININLVKVCREYGVSTPNFLDKPMLRRRPRMLRGDQ